MTFDQACEAFTNALKEAPHNYVPTQPSRQLSSQDANGRWVLRNVNGFLAYVTTTGKVLDQQFQEINA